MTEMLCISLVVIVIVQFTAAWESELAYRTCFRTCIQEFQNGVRQTLNLAMISSTVNAQTLENACRHYKEEYEPCLAEFRDNCSRSYRERYLSKEFYDFLCSDAGTTLFASNGVCIHSKNARKQINTCDTTLHFTYARARADLRAVRISIEDYGKRLCSMTNTYLKCLNIGVTYSCGSGAAYYVTEGKKLNVTAIINCSFVAFTPLNRSTIRRPTTVRPFIEPLTPRQHGDACTISKILDCYFTFYYKYENIRRQMIAAKSKEMYMDFCRDYGAQYRLCVASFQTQCPVLEKSVINTLGNFVDSECSDVGMKLIIAYGECLPLLDDSPLRSQCYNMAMRQYNQSAEVLRYHYVSAYDSLPLKKMICRVQTTYLNCMKRAATQICGLEAGYLLYESIRRKYQLDSMGIVCISEPVDPRIIESITNITWEHEGRNISEFDIAGSAWYWKQKTDESGALSPLEISCIVFGVLLGVTLLAYAVVLRKCK